MASRQELAPLLLLAHPTATPQTAALLTGLPCARVARGAAAGTSRGRRRPSGRRRGHSVAQAVASTPVPAASCSAARASARRVLIAMLWRRVLVAIGGGLVASVVHSVGRSRSASRCHVVRRSSAPDRASSQRNDSPRDAAPPPSSHGSTNRKRTVMNELP